MSQPSSSTTIQGVPSSPHAEPKTLSPERKRSLEEHDDEIKSSGTESSADNVRMQELCHKLECGSESSDKRGECGSVEGRGEWYRGGWWEAKRSAFPTNYAEFENSAEAEHGPEHWDMLAKSGRKFSQAWWDKYYATKPKNGGWNPRNEKGSLEWDGKGAEYRKFSGVPFQPYKAEHPKFGRDPTAQSAPLTDYHQYTGYKGGLNGLYDPGEGEFIIADYYRAMEGMELTTDSDGDEYFVLGRTTGSIVYWNDARQYGRVKETGSRGREGSYAFLRRESGFGVPRVGDQVSFTKTWSEDDPLVRELLGLDRIGAHRFNLYGYQALNLENLSRTYKTNWGVDDKFFGQVIRTDEGRSKDVSSGWIREWSRKGTLIHDFYFNTRWIRCSMEEGGVETGDYVSFKKGVSNNTKGLNNIFIATEIRKTEAKFWANFTRVPEPYEAQLKGYWTKTVTSWTLGGIYQERVEHRFEQLKGSKESVNSTEGHTEKNNHSSSSSSERLEEK